jgi:hypothetical protein
MSSQMRCCRASTCLFISRKKEASSTRRRAMLTYSDLQCGAREGKVGSEFVS